MNFDNLNNNPFDAFASGGFLQPTPNTNVMPVNTNIGPVAGGNNTLNTSTSKENSSAGNQNRKFISYNPKPGSLDLNFLPATCYMLQIAHMKKLQNPKAGNLTLYSSNFPVNQVGICGIITEIKDPRDSQPGANTSSSLEICVDDSTARLWCRKWLDSPEELWDAENNCCTLNVGDYVEVAGPVRDYQNNLWLSAYHLAKCMSADDILYTHLLVAELEKKSSILLKDSLERRVEGGSSGSGAVNAVGNSFIAQANTIPMSGAGGPGFQNGNSNPTPFNSHGHGGGGIGGKNVRDFLVQVLRETTDQNSNKGITRDKAAQLASVKGGGGFTERDVLAELEKLVDEGEVCTMENENTVALCCD